MIALFVLRANEFLLTDKEQDIYIRFDNLLEKSKDQSQPILGR